MELAPRNNQGTNFYLTSVSLRAKRGLPWQVNIPFDEGYVQNVLDISRAIHTIHKI